MENQIWHLQIGHAGAGASAAGDAVAPMPGVIDKVLVKPGQSVAVNEPMVVMVAMKMEYVIRSVGNFGNFE